MADKYYQNKTRHCTIGLSPEQKKALGRIPDHVPEGKPWLFPTRREDGSDWYLPPGMVWIDSEERYLTMTQGVYSMNMFVHCSDEDEFLKLQQEHPEIRAVRDGGDLKGFFGAHAVLTNVTSMKEEIMSNIVSYISGKQHVETLKKDMAEKDKALSDMKSETDKIKAEYERMKLELSILKKK